MAEGQRDGSTVAVQNFPVIGQGTPTEAQFERIRAMGIHNEDIQPSQVFCFDMVASSNGVDGYATRTHETSMEAFVRDLQFGQSLLASHDINLLSYGQSFDARIEDADPTKSWYEAAFFRRWKDPEVAATRLVIGSYYIPRGLTLNGQKTDDIIGGLRYGNIRKASISFYVGSYQCGICGRDMVDGWFGPLPESIWAEEAPDDGELCAHFPGMEYKGRLAYAWMLDSQLLETSLVYKNASPSALLVRKAEEMARRGMLTPSQVGQLEQRLARRLPAFEPTITVAPGARNIDGAHRLAAGGTAVDPTVRTSPPEDEEEPTTAPVADPAPDEPETPAADAGDDEEDETDEAERAAAAAQQRTMRALGVTDLREATLVRLRSEAEMGRQLFSRAVDEAVRARVRAVGPERMTEAHAASYRRSLEASADVEYVLSEVELHGGHNPFKPGRQANPGTLPPAPGDGDRLPPLPERVYDPFTRGGSILGVAHKNGQSAGKES